MSAERRQYPRIPYGAYVECLSGIKQGNVFCRARNLSQGGMLLNTSDEPPALGQTLLIKLVIENERRVVTVRATVVRHDPNTPGDFGICFIELTKESTEFIKDLVEETVHPNS